MTGLSKVYDAFLRQITDDMYMELTKEDTERMMYELLESAIVWFEFPRQALDIIEAEDPDDTESAYFVNDLTNEEINIIGAYMVVEWLGQQLANIENVRMKYSGQDFKLTSQANHLAKLQSLRKEYERRGFHLQRLYKRRKKDSNGLYRSTMHVIMEDLVYPFSKGNENPATDSQEEGNWYDEN